MEQVHIFPHKGLNKEILSLPCILLTELTRCRPVHKSQSVFVGLNSCYQSAVAIVMPGTIGDRCATTFCNQYFPCNAGKNELHVLLFLFFRLCNEASRNCD